MLNVAYIEFHLAFEVGIACDYLRNEEPEEKAYDEYDGDCRQKYGESSLQATFSGLFEKSENVCFDLDHQLVQKICEDRSVYNRAEYREHTADVFSEFVVIEKEEYAQNGKQYDEQGVNRDGRIFLVPVYTGLSSRLLRRFFRLTRQIFFRQIGQVLVFVHMLLLSFVLRRAILL